MPLCKILVGYNNTAGWKVGDIVDVTNPWTLIREGKVILVDEQGNEIPPPSVVTMCPICTFKTVDPHVLASHILTAHPKKGAVKEEKVVPVEEKKNVKAMSPEELKSWRIDNLKKGREKKKAELEAKKTAEVLRKAVGTSV